jgi:hypothetical protein
MAKLLALSDNYYQNRISFVEYREQRTDLLKLIDEDLNGVKNINEIEKNDDSLIEKALSFLKRDKLKETN